MCGICGVISVGAAGAPLPTETLDRMTDLMTHRGPDDRGTHTGDGVALGVRRLSIVDVEGGHQPFSSEDGRVWAIQNGELFNHASVRARLVASGHRFGSVCDTEIIPHLYEQYGDDFPHHLRGMFAIAVWDDRRRRALLVRDRLGIKPLYYANVGSAVVFASELKAVLASGLVPVELDYEAISAYLSLGYVPGPLTPLRNVKKLMPGQRLVVDERGATIETWWRFPRPSEPSDPGPDSEYVEGLREHLEEAVRLRLMSDVPLGAMLSGGLDSSVIVALMAQQVSGPVKTFSVGFAGAPATNELHDARLVARALGTEHHEIELDLGETSPELEDLVWHLDEPLADLSAIGFHALSVLASRHVTVALSGQGADEILAGYPAHRNAAITARWDRLPRMIQNIGVEIGRRVPGRVSRAASVFASADAADRMLAMCRIDDGSVRSIAAGGPLAPHADAARAAVRARLDGFETDAFNTTLYLDAQLGLVDDMLHYFDRVSMAQSLEVRVPFLDHHLVEYSASIPARLKLRGRRGKHVLREVARGLVPDRVIDKPKVGFFNSAVADWVAAQASASIDPYLLSSNPEYASFLDPTRVQALARLANAGTSRGSARLLLAILMLEIWLSSYLPRAMSTGSAISRPIQAAP